MLRFHRACARNTRCSRPAGQVFFSLSFVIEIAHPWNIVNGNGNGLIYTHLLNRGGRSVRS